MKTMSASLKKRFGSLYWQQFFLTAGMVLLTMLLLGVSFFALSYNYTVSEKRDEMNERAKLMASVSVPFLEAADSGQSDDQEENLMSMARVASMVSNVNFLIGDANGNILLTTDEQFVNKTITLPADVTQQIVSEGCYEGRTRLGSMYQLKQYVVGVPAVDSQSGELVGIILAVMENRSLMQMWRSFIGLFFMTSAIILLIAFVVSSLTSMRQIQPIREMVQATRAYGSGEFDVRMQDSDRTDEIGELAASFNAMADSLQETERQRREAILTAEGEKQSRILVAEGHKESKILEAEAEKQAAILHAEAVKEAKIREAEGEAAAIEAVQKATADAIRLLNEANAGDAVIKLKALEAFSKAADGQATKIIIPSEIQGLAGLAEGVVSAVQK